MGVFGTTLSMALDGIGRALPFFFVMTFLLHHSGRESGM